MYSWEWRRRISSTIYCKCTLSGGGMMVLMISPRTRWHISRLTNDGKHTSSTRVLTRSAKLACQTVFWRRQLLLMRPADVACVPTFNCATFIINPAGSITSVNLHYYRAFPMKCYQVLNLASCAILIICIPTKEDRPTAYMNYWILNVPHYLVRIGPNFSPLSCLTYL